MYKKEDLKFLNMKKILTLTNKEIFEIEDELTIEEKIAFIDEIKDGIATYLIDLIEKFDNEKENLAKDQRGYIKTISLKAWIKKNDTRGVLNNDYNYGKYMLFGTEYNIKHSIKCPYTRFGEKLIYTEKNIVHQWYHDLCDKLYSEEKYYFESINPFNIKLQRIHDYGNKYGILNNKKVNDITWHNEGYENNVTEEELDIMIEVFEQIEETVNLMTKELNSKIDGEYID